SAGPKASESCSTISSPRSARCSSSPSGASGDVTDAADPIVARLAAALLARGATVAAAESCTGGMIAAACTSRAGSSAWFERGVVTYSNAAKTDLLGVPATLLDAHGAVSV